MPIFNTTCFHCGHEDEILTMKFTDIKVSSTDEDYLVTKDFKCSRCGSVEFVKHLSKTYCKIKGGTGGYSDIHFNVYRNSDKPIRGKNN